MAKLLVCEAVGNGADCGCGLVVSPAVLGIREPVLQIARRHGLELAELALEFPEAVANVAQRLFRGPVNELRFRFHT